LETPLLKSSLQTTRGDFARGFVEGAIVVGLNHAMSHVMSHGGDTRPDVDGKLTFREARYWYRNGNGESLIIDINSLDLRKVSTSDFSKIGDFKSFNLDGKYFSSSNNALVYGNITLEYLGNNQVRVKPGYDIYDFDIKPWSSKTFIRNVATMAGNLVNGSGQGYIIWIPGKATLK
jgi:hypothetical protein